MIGAHTLTSVTRLPARGCDARPPAPTSKHESISRFEGVPRGERKHLYNEWRWVCARARQIPGQSVFPIFRDEGGMWQPEPRGNLSLLAPKQSADLSHDFLVDKTYDKKVSTAVRNDCARARVWTVVVTYASIAPCSNYPCSCRNRRTPPESAPRSAHPPGHDTARGTGA